MRFVCQSACLIAVAALISSLPTVAQEKAAQQKTPQQAKRPVQRGEKPKGKLNAAHILLMHKESRDSRSERSKAEALKLANELTQRARNGGASDFAKLAAEFSDGPSKSNGGDLGNFAAGRMVKPFSDATSKLKIGDVSDPVESVFGYHVILRKDVTEEYKASHIVIMHKDVPNAPSTVKRTKADALKLARHVEALARKPGADFIKLAQQHSDDGGRGGLLPNFSPGQIIAPISDAATRLKIGEVSKPVESKFGYHIVLRRRLWPESVGAKHILVMHKDSARNEKGITRSKPQALQRVNEIIGKLRAGQKFEALAKQYSDGPSGEDGGELGTFKTGTMDPFFEEAAFECSAGKIVPKPIETVFGYHLIYRYK